MSCTLILPCAGSGQRFGGTAKQLRLVNGIPLFLHSIRAFRQHVQHIVLPCSAALQTEIANILQTHNEDVQLVAGGDSRSASVLAGLQHCPADTTKVLVHDAVRPCITPAIISQCIAALDEHEAVLTAIPCTDTLKQQASGELLRTLDRSQIYQAQTPQGFRFAGAIERYQQALSSKQSYTDDISIFEHAEIPIHIVNGSRLNIKVTYPEDLSLVEAILNSAE